MSETMTQHVQHFFGIPYLSLIAITVHTRLWCEISLKYNNKFMEISSLSFLTHQKVFVTAGKGQDCPCAFETR